MTDTTYTAAQLAALEAALASGTLKVSYEGKSIDYRSMDELERAINTVRRGLDRQSGKKKSRRVHLASNRGL